MADMTPQTIQAKRDFLLILSEAQKKTDDIVCGETVARHPRLNRKQLPPSDENLPSPSQAGDLLFFVGSPPFQPQMAHDNAACWKTVLQIVERWGTGYGAMA